MAVNRRLGGIRKVLEERVVAPLFKGIDGVSAPDESLPEVVLANRRQRARQRLLDALVSRGSASVPVELRRRAESLVRDWAARSFDDSFEAVRELEIDCAREHDLIQAQDSGDPAQVLAVLERDYRRRVVKEFGFVELRGIQVSQRVTLDLEKVYVPLYLEEPIQQTTKAEGLERAFLWRRMPATEAFFTQSHK